MRSASDLYKYYVDNEFRPVNARCFISFTKEYNADIGIFTIPAIYDDFDTSALDILTWTESNDSQSDQAGGFLELYTTTGAGYYNVTSNDTFDLTGLSLETKIEDIGNQALSSYEAYPLGAQIDGNNKLEYLITGGTIYARKVVGGSASSVWNDTYSGTDHKYLRIRESGGDTYWETSADGETWTERHSESNPITVTALNIVFQVGTWGAEATTTTMQIDYLYIKQVSGKNYSEIGGGDFVKGDGDVVQEWDKYEYIDVSDRVVNVEVTQQVEQLFSLATAFGEITLTNYDDYFTKGAGSEIDDYLLPQRPIRVLGGFDNEMVTAITGITYGMPEIDEQKKTATFKFYDFLYTILQRPLVESVLYEDQRTDEIVIDLFDNVGIDSSQVMVDTGSITIPYAYFTKDQKLGEALKKILQVENARLTMDSEGVIKMKTRTSYDDSVVKTYTETDNIIGKINITEDYVINVCEISGEVLEVGNNQLYWEMGASQYIELPPEATTSYWVNFDGAVAEVDEPENDTTATTSTFSVNTASDGSGTDNNSDVSVTSTSLFSESYKIDFYNGNASTLYITDLDIFARPVIVANEIYVREQIDDSVDKYDERILTIDNNFFQDNTQAQGLALVILRDNSDYEGVAKIIVKGDWRLEVEDTVKVWIKNNVQNYKIKKIESVLDDNGFTQALELRKFTVREYFTIGVSTIGGDAMIYP